jgi:uncharacterized protein
VVVAVMVPVPEGASGRWVPDFWVDDLEAAVARSEQHGGTTVQAPFEAPPGRSAVLAEPAGVTFTVSRARPPAG